MSYVKIIKNTIKQISKNLKLSVKVCDYYYFAVPHNCIIIETSSLSGFNREALLDAFNTLNIPFFAIKLKSGDLALVDLEDISIFEQKPKLLDLKIRSSRFELHPFVYNYRALGIGELEFDVNILLGDYVLEEFYNGLYKEFDINLALAVSGFLVTKNLLGTGNFEAIARAIPRGLVFKGVFATHLQSDNAITIPRLILFSQILKQISKLTNKHIIEHFPYEVYDMKNLIALFEEKLKNLAPEIYPRLTQKRVKGIDNRLKKIAETVSKLQS